jgi:7-carboxy-7-deazaguanine synthase
MEAEEIWQELVSLGGDGFSFVTISGGNPALLKNLEKLIHILKENKIRICLETQGSKWQDWVMDIEELTISPKPPSSRMVTNFDVLDRIINKRKDADPTHNTSIKVVVFDDFDYSYAKKVHFRYLDIPFFLQVGNDDRETMNKQELLEQLVQKYESLINKVMLDKELKNVKVLPQLHTYIWGNKRGV